MKKVLTVLLIAAILLPCFLTSCSVINNLFGKQPEATTPTVTTPEATTPDVTTPEVTTPEVTTPEVTTPEVTTPEVTTPEVTTPEVTTPEVTTPDTPPVIIPPEPQTLTLTTVKITTEDDPSVIYAGAELQAYLAKKGITSADDGFPIFIGIDSSLAMDGFKIEVSFEGTPSMTIMGGNTRGAIYAVYRFLQQYAGCRFLAPGLETVKEGDVIVTEGVMMDYAPAMLGRRMNWRSVSGELDWMIKNGINNPSIPAELGGDYLNYGSYFVHSIAYLAESTYPYPTYATNPCLTDPDIYATVLKNVRKELEKNPQTTIISVSQSDYEESCYCPNCARIAEENGGNYSAVWITFVNKIAEELEDEYPDLLIDTLAYKNTQSPPTKVKPHKNVCVRLCSINCCFTHALDDPNCPKGKQFHDDIVGWGAICDNVHIWDYTTNFHYYISTFANFGVIQKNMKFYAENNVRCMFPQGNSQGASGEFGELRAFLLAQLMWNPYMTEEEYYGLMDDFLQAYYGAGWESVRAFIDKTTELAANGGYKINGDETEGDATCGQGIYGHPLTAITRQEYLDNEAYFDELWATAKELAGDRIEYVKRSEMQWRLTKLYLHPNAEEAQKLIDDAKAAGVVWKEGQVNVLPESDLSLSPYYWVYGN